MVPGECIARCQRRGKQECSGAARGGVQGGLLVHMTPNSFNDFYCR